MGNECSCVFSGTPANRTTEFKFPSSVKQTSPHSPVTISVNDCLPVNTLQSEIFKLPAQSHLFQFYTRTSHRLSRKVLKLQKTLPISFISDDDLFDLPVESEEEVFYFGQWEDDQKSGKGVQVNPDGSVYTGHFRNNKYSGLGRLIFPNGEYFEGTFKKDKPEGQGTYFISKNRKIEAVYHKGIVQGNCNILWDSATYTGQFQSGSRTGIGKLTQDSKTFEGEFFKNLIQGYGCCTWENGKTYSGQWVNNKMHGFGVFEWPDGRKYEGEYREGIKEGKGRMTWPDGRVYDGEWVKGKQEGLALYTFLNKKTRKLETRKGKWKNGERVNWVIKC